MQRIIYVFIFLNFVTNGFAQDLPKKFTKNSTFQFNNESYKITWLIENGKYGLLDTKKQEFIIPPVYDFAEIYDEGYSLIQKDGHFGFINHQGEMLTSLDYNAARHHNNQLILVEKNGKFTFLDKRILSGQHLDFAGNPEFREEYDMVISSYNDGFSIVVLGEKYGYINDLGEEIIPLMYDGATLFEGQVAAVKFGEKWGVIDKANGKIIDFKYTEMRPFNNKISVAKNGKKWGAIDMHDQTIVPFKYKFLSDFNSDKVALAKKNKHWGVINNKGKILVDFEYEYDLNYLSLAQLTDGYIWLKKDDLWGAIDLKYNKITIPFEYEEIHELDGNEITVVKDGEIMIIDEFGTCIKNCSEYIDLENLNFN
jgi:hypothetical protein